MATRRTAEVPRSRPMVELCELGPLGFRRAGNWFSIRGERTSVLVAALSLHGRNAVTSLELCEAIWPSPGQPPTARQSLANLVLRLRDTFGGEVIESTRVGYRLGDQVSTDREQFVVEIGAAVELADSDPLEALTIVTTALNRWRGEPWTQLERPIEVEADRAALLELRALGLRTQATALMALSRCAEAVPILREMLSADPYDESTAELLATALGELGRRAEALRVISATRRSLAKRGLVERRTLGRLEDALLELDQDPVTSIVRSPRQHSALSTTGSGWAGLPSVRTSFIGREEEIRSLLAVLDEAPVVTILGPGGAGKSRLATEAAAQSEREGATGFVDLVSARSASDVEIAFGLGLGVPRNQFEMLSRAERWQALVSSKGPGLLVVDNCEHVVDHVRTLVDVLLTANNELTVLATSRVPLDLSGERHFRIPRFDRAIELFCERMTASGVSIDPGEPTVAAICELVDDLPLAIELASAQGPYRTLEEIAAELRRGVSHHDRAKSDSRHATMVEAIRWSKRLLPPDVQKALVNLGVFVAPFERSDAAAVLDAARLDEDLDTLVRWSLLERATVGDRSIYRLLEPIRQHAAAELRRSRTATQVALRYADWLLDLTEHPPGEVQNRFSTMDALEPRLANSLTAIDALRNSGRHDDAARLASRLAGSSCLHGRTTELIEVLEELWPVSDDTEVCAEALVALVLCADVNSDNARLGRALGHLDALELPRQSRHRIFAHRMNAMWVMWAEMLSGSRLEKCSDLLGCARDLESKIDSPHDRAWIEYSQGCLHLFEGDWTSAEVAARRSRAAASGTIAHVLATTSLAFARLHLGDPDGALAITAAHPERNRSTYFGESIGIVSALATVVQGDITDGLSQLDSNLRRAKSVSFVLGTDNTAIAVAHAAHILGDDDITLELLNTGVRGKGVHIGHLVPHLCRELGIPLTARYLPDDERISRSRRIASLAESSLAELARRHA